MFRYIFLVMAFALLLWAVPAAQAEEVHILRGNAPVARFQVELARTPQEQAKGLMFRKTMPEQNGMLFVFEKSGPRSMWMKNTLIPLDMLFADEKGVIVKIAANAKPLDETPITSEGMVKYVLEIQGGMAAQKGIQIKDMLVFPSQKAE